MTPETKQIIAQVIGIFAMATCISSFQFKKNTHFFIVQGISSTLFFVHYLLLGQNAGAFMNLLAVMRSVCLNVKFLRSRVFEVLLIIGFVVIAIFSFESWLTILILIAQIGGTIVFWQNKAKRIRLFQLFICSPCWLLHNVFAFSIGGIITEVFNIVSTTISIIRFRKSGFGEQ